MLRWLSHSFVESPDMLNSYNGTVTLETAGANDLTLNGTSSVTAGGSGISFLSGKDVVLQTTTLSGNVSTSTASGKVRITGAASYGSGNWTNGGTLDIESGGSIDGLLAALGQAIEMTNETTRVIPGHGPMATRAELSAYRDVLTGLRAQIFDAIEQGRSLDEIKAMRLADRYGRDTDFITPDAFVEAVHGSLTAAPEAHHH